MLIQQRSLYFHTVSRSTFYQVTTAKSKYKHPQDFEIRRHHCPDAAAPLARCIQTTPCNHLLNINLPPHLQTSHSLINNKYSQPAHTKTMSSRIPPPSALSFRSLQHLPKIPSLITAPTPPTQQPVYNKPPRRPQEEAPERHRPRARNAACCVQKHCRDERKKERKKRRIGNNSGKAAGADTLQSSNTGCRVQGGDIAFAVLQSAKMLDVSYRVSSMNLVHISESCAVIAVTHLRLATYLTHSRLPPPQAYLVQDG